ncbi:MAG: response regulator [Alphaproteobacteria bacterium]|nr:response regulator [Alphaproteobacteria bacterium]
MGGRYNPAVPRILLVEDDAPLAGLIQEYLQRNGMQVEVEGRGDRAVSRILDAPPDLVVLDLMLPGLDGLAVCRAVRERYAGPILMASAQGEDVDQIVGLEMGADDYLPKPLNPRLLLARVRALLRRGPPERAERRDLGGLEVDRSLREARLDGALLELTTGEFETLWVLAAQAGHVVDRDALSLAVRGAPHDGLDRTIDVLISRLRRKLGPRWIKTVRGEGYQLIRLG